MNEDEGWRLIPVPQWYFSIRNEGPFPPLTARSYGSGTQGEEKVCHRSALVKVRTGTGDEPVEWEKQLELFQQALCHVNSRYKTIILNLVKGKPETQTVTPGAAVNEVRKLSRALFHLFKSRHPEYSSGAMTEYLDFRKEYCGYDFSIPYQKRTAELALITFYCKLSSLLEVETLTLSEKRRASDDSTDTIPRIKRRKPIIEGQQTPGDASDKESQNDTASSEPDTVNDSPSQPTPASNAPVLGSIDCNIDCSAEIYHDYDETSSNLLNLTLPPGYPERSCSSFTLCYSTDLLPHHDCPSEHVLLKSQDHCSEQGYQGEVSLESISWDYDSLQAERLTNQTKKSLYR